MELQYVINIRVFVMELKIKSEINRYFVFQISELYYVNMELMVISEEMASTLGSLCNCLVCTWACHLNGSKLAVSIFATLTENGHPPPKTPPWDCSTNTNVGTSPINSLYF